MESGGGARSAQDVRCENLGLKDDARATALGADGTSASRLMTDVHWGLPANCRLEPANTSFSTGVRQQSSLVPGWLHSGALFRQQAIAAGVEWSQYRLATGDPTRVTDKASVATALVIVILTITRIGQPSGSLPR